MEWSNFDPSSFPNSYMYDGEWIEEDEILERHGYLNEDIEELDDEFLEGGLN